MHCARVNRVFKDKSAGLIVDYIGIAQSPMLHPEPTALSRLLPGYGGSRVLLDGALTRGFDEAIFVRVRQGRLRCRLTTAAQQHLADRPPVLHHWSALTRDAAASLLTFSIPTYWMGLMAILIFFYLLRWAPPPMRNGGWGRWAGLGRPSRSVISWKFAGARPSSSN